MSIKDNKAEYDIALKKAHEEFPPKLSYSRNPDNCWHDFSFIIYCDNFEWDIARCPYCGTERIVCCTFDDDYD